MFRTPVLILALVAAPALAQSTINITWDPGNQERFNAADCASSEPLTFTWDTAGAGGAYDFYVTYEFDGDCDPADNNIIVPDNGEGIPMFNLVAQPAGQLYTEETTVDIFLPSEACIDSAGFRNVVGVMCFTLYETALTDPRSRVDTFARNVIYDTTIPLTPEIQNLVAADGAVSFDAAEPNGDLLDDGVVSIVVQLRGCDDGSAIPPEFTEVADSAPASGGDAGVTCAGPFFEQTFSSTSVSFNGLSTSSDYEVRVLARDDFSNTSEASEVSAFNPLAEVGPLSTYDGGGTPYGFNCAQSSASPIALAGLALLGLLGLRRRRSGRRPGGALLALTLVIGAGAASADPGRVTADLYAGPYLPDIDREAAANGLYSCFFNDAVLPEIGGDVTFGIFDAFGSLELGIGLSVAQVSGVTFNRDALVTDPSCNSPTAGGRSQLSVMKLRPHLAYRFDYFLDEFGFPIVPYGELGLVGLGYAFTRNGAFDDGGDASTASPAGAVFGYEAVLGIALELSFLDRLDPFTPNTVHRARARGSFLHPFFYAEAAIQEIDNFGGGGFVFSPRDVFGTGLPMMLRFGVRLELP